MSALISHGFARRILCYFITEKSKQVAIAACALCDTSDFRPGRFILAAENNAIREGAYIIRSGRQKHREEGYYNAARMSVRRFAQGPVAFAGIIWYKR